ncbi:MAG: YlbF family regulator [Phycisphaerales bacterium]|nr:YlbF family regulator [Phycisphaerales bacterium]
MPVTTEQILEEAAKVGQLVAQHPAIAKYKQAQKAIADDPDAARLLSDFDRQLESLARQEQSGMGVTDAQRQQLETLQSQIISHIKIKALNMAQVEFVDLLRKVTQTIQAPLSEAPRQSATGPAPVGPRLAR